MKPRQVVVDARSKGQELTKLPTYARRVLREASQPEDLLPRCYDLTIQRNLGFDVFVKLAEEVERLAGRRLADRN